MKKLIFFFILFITACSRDISVLTKNEDNKIFISYPTTNISSVDKFIKIYIDTTYNSFKKFDKSELNIDYIYNEIDNYISIKLYSYIDEIKYNLTTINYDKTNKCFFTLSKFTNNKLSGKYFYFDYENLYVINETEEIEYKLDDFNIYFNKKLVTKNTIYHKNNIDINKPMVAITFDDGPSRYTRKIIDLLNQYNAKATFFILGNKVNFYNETISIMHNYGHEIGNHSYSHRWLTRLSDEELKKQINDTQELIYSITNNYPKLLRPTYGAINNRLRKNTNLNIVLWDLDSNDWKLKNKNKISENILKNVKNNDIILFHDTYEWTYNSLKIIIPELINQGYQLVTVSDLLYIKNLQL